MKTFLIDLENVKNQGFTGIDKLAAEDRVFVFYSDGANTLNIPTIQLINRSACSVEYVPLQRSGHNAMDFQIVGLLGFLIGSEKQGHFGIISQDQGYLAPVDFFMDHSADVLDIHVLVTPNILTAVRKWEAQEQSSRKVLTTGKQKNEKGHAHRNADVIEVEPVQSQTAEVAEAEPVEAQMAENVQELQNTVEAVVEETPVVEVPVEETAEIVNTAESASVEETSAEETAQENEPAEEIAAEPAEEEMTAEASAPEETSAEAEETKEETAAPVSTPEVKNTEIVGVYTDEISNAFVGAIVDSPENTSHDEENTAEVVEKKNGRNSRNKKKKQENGKAESKTVKAENKTAKAEGKSAKAETKAAKAESKQSNVENKPAERAEKKKETRKSSKKSAEIPVDPQTIQTVHNLIGDKLDEEQVQLEAEIVKAVLVSDGKNHFYQYFNHTLGREKGGNLYHAIRNDYEKLVKALKA